VTAPPWSGGLADILEELGATAAPVPGPPAAAADPAAIPAAGGQASRRAATPAAVRAGTHARTVLAALVDGGVLGAPQLAALTGLEPATLAAALLELELAGLVRRTAVGVQAVALGEALGREEP
jgi:hypothetical protein